MSERLTNCSVNHGYEKCEKIQPRTEQKCTYFILYPDSVLLFKSKKYKNDNSLTIIKLTTMKQIINISWDKCKTLVKDNTLIISLLFIYVLFYQFWENLIGNQIINKFFCYFEPSLLNNILFIFACIGCIALGFYSKEKYVSQRTKQYVLFQFFFGFIIDIFVNNLVSVTPHVFCNLSLCLNVTELSMLTSFLYLH